MIDVEADPHIGVDDDECEMIEFWLDSQGDWPGEMCERRETDV